MIGLFTDFGLEGPYLGQVRMVLAQHAPGVPVIDLLSDAPACDPRASAYLLAALLPWTPPGAVLLCVVDPGVGGERSMIALRIAGRWLVGPDNGLMAVAARQHGLSQGFLLRQPEHQVSASFHGRDIFAPAAARLASGDAACLADPLSGLDDLAGADWPEDLAEIIYIDRFGNAMTGLRSACLPPGVSLRAGGRTLTRSRTFSDQPKGDGFWYDNANGLAEIAVNGGRADILLDLAVGDTVTLAESR